jgi:RHS repeat-associated protein
VAVYSRTTGGANTLRYIREDHQGGVSSILASDGTTYVKESFTAFGTRRSSCTWSGPPTSGDLSLIDAVTRHGYTWQTALGAMGLNDMNGRIQDAITGRFLSPDPTIPNPGFTQSFNRYSYVNNNPLTFSDPTGFTQADTQCVGDCPDESQNSGANSPGFSVSTMSSETVWRTRGFEPFDGNSDGNASNYDGNSNGAGDGGSGGKMAEVVVQGDKAEAEHAAAA